MTFYEMRVEFDRIYVTELLRRHPNRSEAARVAGLNRTHLYGLAKRLGVECAKPQTGLSHRATAETANPVAATFLNAQRGDRP